MSTFNLVEMAKSYFNHDLVNKASANLGESEGGITKALSALVPSIIGGMADKASTPEGANAVAQMATAEHKDGILDVISGFFHQDNNSNLLSKGSGLISSLFGTSGQSNMLTSLVSNFAGVKSSSAGSLLSLALPTILGLFGRHTAENNISASGISSVLADQKKLAMGALPAGFSLSAASSSPVSSIKETAQTAHRTYEAAEEKTGGGAKWILPLLLLAGVAVAAYYFYNNRNKEKTEEVTTVVKDTAKTETVTTVTSTTTTSKGMLDTATGDFVYNAGDMVTLALPNNGGELKVGSNSTEAQLVAFLNDKNAMVDTVKGNWYEFTDVHFKTASSDLTDASATQLKNLVMIAKAYPNAKFKFGGYTDNTGNAGKNVILSQKRADAVNAMVLKLGAAASSFAGAKGYGPEFPVGDNGTAEGKAMNRRVAVNVKAK